MTATAIPEPAPLQLTPPPPRHRRWLVGGCLAVGALAVLVVIWARTRPGFDPYGWLTWGQPDGVRRRSTRTPRRRGSRCRSCSRRRSRWPATSRCTVAVVLGRGVAGGQRVRLPDRLPADAARRRRARRLADPRRRRAAVAAGLFAAVVLLGMQDYLHYILSAQSDTMIVALCLGAHRLRPVRPPPAPRSRLAVLGRARPARGVAVPGAVRAVVLAGGRRPCGGCSIAEAVVLLLLWFGIPALTSRSFFVAGDNALGSGRALHEQPDRRHDPALPRPLPLARSR